MRCITIAFVLLVGCKGGDHFTNIDGGGVDGSADDDAGVDAGTTDASADAAPSGSWSNLIPIEVNTAATSELSPQMSSDGVTLYFVGERGDEVNLLDVDYTTRSAVGQPFNPGQFTIIPVDTAGNDELEPFESHNRLELYLVRNGNILVSRRGSLVESWPPPTDTTLDGRQPMLLSDGLVMYYLNPSATCPVQTCRTRVTRASTSSPTWETPVLESFPPGGYRYVHLSGDGLRVLMSDPLNPTTTLPLAVASRASVGGAWGLPMPVTEFQTSGGIKGARWSWDEQEMFLTVAENPAMQLNLYRSRRE